MAFGRSNAAVKRGGLGNLFGTVLEKETLFKMGEIRAVPVIDEVQIGRFATVAQYGAGTSSYSRVYLNSGEAPMPLSEPRTNIAATAANKRILFAGGANTTSSTSYFNNIVRANVDVYDKNGVRSAAENLSVARDMSCGGTIGEYALFVGGQTDNSRAVNTAEAYDRNLTRISLTNISSIAHSLHSANVKGKVLFGAGNNLNNKIFIYDDNLVYSQIGASFAAGTTSVTAFGNAVFAGGGKVTAIDENLSSRSLTSFYVPRAGSSGAVAGENLLFVGGTGSGGAGYTAVDIYDKNLVKTDHPDTPGNYYATNLTSISIKSNALFAGGVFTSNGLGTVMIYDKNLTCNYNEYNTSPANFAVAGAAFDDIGIFAGGQNSQSMTNAVYSNTYGFIST